MLGPMAAQAQNGVSERRCLDGRPDRSIIEKEREILQGSWEGAHGMVFSIFAKKY
jgi:hypothetical protein